MPRPTRYDAYLASPGWQKRRRRVLRRDGHRCRDCQATPLGGLHVHHLSYRRLGREPLDHLITLCDACHKKRHRKQRDLRVPVQMRKPVPIWRRSPRARRRQQPARIGLFGLFGLLVAAWACYMIFASVVAHLAR